MLANTSYHRMVRGGIVAWAIAACAPAIADERAQEASITAPQPTSTGAFANDLGPPMIDISTYPTEIQATYQVFLHRCASCHTAARALNAELVEVTSQELETLGNRQPELFSDPRLWRIGTDVWREYVRRMMRKPGSTITPVDAQAIQRFLVYDSRARKLGAAAAAWRAHRIRLLQQFRERYPERYRELYGE